MRSDSTVYRGHRPGANADTTTPVFVTVEEPGKPTHQLTPDRSWKVRNHSPDGFNYGYSGSGPSQLALAILIDFTDDGRPSGLAASRYQDFKFDFISKMAQDAPFEIHGQAIRLWLEQQERVKPFEEEADDEPISSADVLDGDA